MSSSAENLCLRWNDFEQNITSTFGALRQDRDFVDVTLVSEDGQTIELHKVVLAASSPFFLQVLRKSNGSQHPWIIMRGTRFEDLAAIVDFLYFGEANVLQENLDGFLALAAELQLKGLSGKEEDKSKTKTVSQAPINKKDRKKAGEAKKTITENQTIVKTEDENDGKEHPGMERPENNSTVAVLDQGKEDKEAVDQEIRSLMERRKVNFDSTGRAAYMCKVCGKEGQRSNIWNHIEAKHATSHASYTCDLCGKNSKSRNGLFLHKSVYHRK